MTKGEERARASNLEKAIQKPIRVQLIRPEGLAVTDGETIKRANAQMEELHEKAVAAARREKLKLLCCRYSVAEDDYEGLALALAIDHEPGFQVDRQLVELPPGFSGPVGPVKDGKLINKRGRRIEWTVERFFQLLQAVEGEKEKSGLTEDLEALRRLARRKQWSPPPNQRGGYDAWVRTLQSRLHDAKRLKRKVDALNAELEEIARRIGK
jgi:hypothetical protein